MPTMKEWLLNLIEEDKEYIAYMKLVKFYGIKQQDIAEEMNLNRCTINRYLKEGYGAKSTTETIKAIINREVDKVDTEEI